MLVLCSMLGARGALTESLRARIDAELAAPLFALSVGSVKAADARAAKWDPKVSPGTGVCVVCSWGVGR